MQKFKTFCSQSSSIPCYHCLLPGLYLSDSALALAPNVWNCALCKRPLRQLCDFFFLQDFCRYWPRLAGEVLKTGTYVIKLNASNVLSDSLTAFNMAVQSKVSSDQPFVGTLSSTKLTIFVQENNTPPPSRCALKPPQQLSVRIIVAIVCWRAVVVVWRFFTTLTGLEIYPATSRIWFTCWTRWKQPLRTTPPLSSFSACEWRNVLPLSVPEWRDMTSFTACEWHVTSFTACKWHNVTSFSVKCCVCVWRNMTPLTEI